MSLEVATLRELFRNLQAFRAVYETDGVDTIRDLDGEEWNVFDLDYLYRMGLPRLPLRQRQAIELCLVQNMKEVDAAKVMGVSPTNPVAMYATSGLAKLVTMIEAGVLPYFRSDGPAEACG